MDERLLRLWDEKVPLYWLFVTLLFSFMIIFVPRLLLFDERAVPDL